MAVWYVYSGAAGTATGADWTNAKTTLQAAITAGAAGDTYYVAHDHAETAASATTITFKGTAGAIDKVLCVNRAGSVPPVAADLTTGASITTTGANQLTVAGTSQHAYIQGVAFNAGTGATNAPLFISLAFGRFVNCALKKLGTNNAFPAISWSPGASQASKLILENTTMQVGNTGDSFRAVFGEVIWRNTTSAITGATLPTTLIQNTGSPQFATYLLDGVDLSALGSGKTLVQGGVARQKVTLLNCKLGSSVTVAGTPTSPGGSLVDLIGCDSGTANYRNERYAYEGTLTTETTIKRTAGASNGTTAYSWKIVTTANANIYSPFETFEGVIWNDTTGSSKTLTVHTVTDNVTLTDAEAWVEVEYLGSSSQPAATLITDAAATILTSGTNQTSDSGEAWTTTGLTTPVKQALAVTFTPQMKGPIRWRVKVAKASTTVYVCPNADVT